MLDWKPGDQVICIDSACRGQVDLTGTVLPLKGCVYTLRDILVVPDENARYRGAVCVRLDELRNKPSPLIKGGDEQCFIAEAFRKVQPTSIDDLKALLPAPKKSRVVEYIE